MLPASRSEAKALSAKRYFTGKPCKYGHVDVRVTHTGHCLQCHLLGNQRWQKRHLERWQSYTRRYRRRHPELIRAQKREQSRRHKLQRLYLAAWRKQIAESMEMAA